MPSYHAVLFDLDGTLLPIDTHDFMHGYFKALGVYFASQGCDPHAVLEGIKLGTKAMLEPDGATTNEQRFWDFFTPYMHGRVEGSFDWESLLARFYDEVFPTLGASIEADPLVPRVIDTLRAKGYRLALATQPLFPPVATAHRLAWTGADPGAFELVTAYHNSLYTKPDPRYYASVLEQMGVPGGNALMVGNDLVEDFAACSCGCDLYLVTDHLLDHGTATTAAGASELVDLVDHACAKADLATTKHGSMAELLAFVETLPAVK